jgi:hypothetical protein
MFSFLVTKNLNNMEIPAVNSLMLQRSCSMLVIENVTEGFVRTSFFIDEADVFVLRGEC